MLLSSQSNASTTATPRTHTHTHTQMKLITVTSCRHFQFTSPLVINSLQSGHLSVRSTASVHDSLWESVTSHPKHPWPTKRSLLVHQKRESQNLFSVDWWCRDSSYKHYKLYSRAAQQFLKWGVQVRERSERKKFFLTLPLLAPGGGHKTGYYSFHYCNYDV